MHQLGAIVPCLALLNPGHSYLPKPCPKQTPTKSWAIQGNSRSSRQLNFKKFSAPPTHYCLLFILGQPNPGTPAALFYHAIPNRYQFINSPVAVQFLHLAKTLPYFSPQLRLGPIKVNHTYHFNRSTTENLFLSRHTKPIKSFYSRLLQSSFNTQPNNCPKKSLNQDQRAN